ncbi:MAG: type II secretion system inner membrane protein GspF [Deltaproteobacteria bacterium]|nr:type II secretion system inner membrane protein GspF [Deltaproteobacteria bacterium]
MAIYEYKALDAAGKTIRGMIEADSVKTARVKLKKNGLFLNEIAEKSAARGGKAGARGASPGGGGFGFFGNVKMADIALTTRQLASLIKANIPIVEALTALIDQVENERLKIVLSTVRGDVNEGSSLAKAMSKHPKVFSNIFVNMIEAGEASGTLPLVLLRLADFQESQVRLKNKVQSALMYPVLMMIASFAMLIGIFVGVIPKIVKIFESMNKPMPLQTRVLIWISDFIVNWWFLVAGAAALAYFLFRKWINSPKGRRSWDGLLLKVPLLGQMIRMLAVARFANTMATLLAGGVPILTAMNIVKSIVANTLITEAIVQARENVTEGQSIAEPLKRSRQFPPLVIHMIAIGEKTGELPQMLQSVASTYEEQVSVKIEGLTSLLEPAMIIFMGVIVGGIVASVFVPLIEMNNLH